MTSSNLYKFSHSIIHWTALSLIKKEKEKKKSLVRGVCGLYYSWGFYRELTSRQDPNSSSQLDKRRKKQKTTKKKNTPCELELTVRSAQPHSVLHLFSKAARLRALITRHWYLAQPIGLSKEECFYAGADWLKRICQLESGERSTGAQFSAVVWPVLCSEWRARQGSLWP